MEHLLDNIKYIDKILYIPQELFKLYDIDDIKLIVYDKFGLEAIPEQYFEITEKRIGQNKFRHEIIERDKYCVLTKSNSDMCEACHIISYNECNASNKYDINNGILLESGLHKLFDKYLWSVNPTTQKVEVSNKLLNDNSYWLINKYNNNKLNFNDNILNNLVMHYNKFIKNQ